MYDCSFEILGFTIDKLYVYIDIFAVHRDSAPSQEFKYSRIENRMENTYIECCVDLFKIVT